MVIMFKTCDIFECKRQSLQRWVEKYLEYKELKRKKRYIEYIFNFLICG